MATKTTTSVQTLSTYTRFSGRRLARCLSLLAVIAVSGLDRTPPSPRSRAGLSPDLSWGISNADQDKTAAALKDVGSRWVRLNVEWGSTETSNNTYDSWMLSHYDRAVDVARANGQRVLMLVSQSPSWASGSSNKQAPPQNPADYADFVPLPRRPLGRQGRGLAGLERAEHLALLAAPALTPPSTPSS